MGYVLSNTPGFYQGILSKGFRQGFHQGVLPEFYQVISPEFYQGDSLRVIEVSLESYLIPIKWSDDHRNHRQVSSGRVENDQNGFHQRFVKGFRYGLIIRGSIISSIKGFIKSFTRDFIRSFIRGSTKVYQTTIGGSLVSCLISVIIGIIYKFHPDRLRLINKVPSGIQLSGIPSEHQGLFNPCSSSESSSYVVKIRVPFYI